MKQVPLQECKVESLTMAAFEEVFSLDSEALEYIKDMAENHFTLTKQTLKISVTGHSFGASVATLVS